GHAPLISVGKNKGSRKREPLFYGCRRPETFPTRRLRRRGQVLAAGSGLVRRILCRFLRLILLRGVCRLLFRGGLLRLGLLPGRRFGLRLGPFFRRDGGLGAVAGGRRGLLRDRRRRSEKEGSGDKTGCS